MKICIYSVNLGGYDRFRPSEHLANYPCYYVTDELPPDSHWEPILVEPGDDPKRTAGRHKILSHRMPEHDISLYMDASVEWTAPIEPLLRAFAASKADIMIPFHPNRGCTYDEAIACKKAKLDDQKLIDEQMGRYRLEGFPARYGMVATTIILRRNTSLVKTFNTTWYGQLIRGSRRDQLSVMYASWKTGAKIELMPLNIYKNEFFKKRPHAV